MFNNYKQKFYAGTLFILGLLFGLTLGQYSTVRQIGNSGIVEGADVDLLVGETNESPQESEYQGYLGIYENHIAIYDGLPPHGILRHVMLDYEVRDDVRPELEKGIPFTDTYDLLRLLENYTS